MRLFPPRERACVRVDISMIHSNQEENKIGGKKSREEVTFFTFIFILGQTKTKNEKSKKCTDAPRREERDDDIN